MPRRSHRLNRHHFHPILGLPKFKLYFHYLQGITITFIPTPTPIIIGFLLFLIEFVFVIVFHLVSLFELRDLILKFVAIHLVKDLPNPYQIYFLNLW